MINELGFSIARGITGISAVNKFGRNPDVDSAGNEDIWGIGGNWVQPTAARVHACVSSSAADTAAGTGARTVSISGLDANFLEISETVTLNGVTPVNTVNSYIILHRALVATAGTGLTNAGVLTFTAAVDSTVSLSMIAGAGQSQFGIYQVPAGYTAYLTKITTSMQNASTTATADVQLLIKPFGGAWNLKLDLALANNGTSIMTHTWDIPLVVTQKSIIRVHCDGCSTNNTDVATTYDMVLVAN